LLLFFAIYVPSQITFNWERKGGRKWKALNLPSPRSFDHVLHVRSPLLFFRESGKAIATQAMLVALP
jgi:hypothetical protein